MPASSYHLHAKGGEELYNKIKDWSESHPEGTKIKVKGLEPDIMKRASSFLGPTRRPWETEVEVTESRCEEIGDGIASRCGIELKDVDNDGQATILIECSPSTFLVADQTVLTTKCKLEIISEDFPSPTEFDFARQELGINFVQRTSWCFDEGTWRHCSAWEVVDDGFSHQMGLVGRGSTRNRQMSFEELEAQMGLVGRGSTRNRQVGPWSDPDLWDKAKEKYPNKPYEAWRWYWEELKRKR